MENIAANKLSNEELAGLPPVERARYLEGFIFNVLQNERTGSTPTELEKVTGLSITTISKYLEVLFSKRKLYRVRRGNSITYFTNGKIHNSIDKRVVITNQSGEAKKYRIQMVENPDGEQLYVQEIQPDENGMDRAIAGIMIPRTGISNFKEIFEELSKDEAKIEE